MIKFVSFVQRCRIIYRYETETGVVWVVAAGIHRAGNRDDIYTRASR